MCVEDCDIPQMTELRSSDLGENAVAEPEVRPRCRWMRLMGQEATSGAVTSRDQHSRRTLAPQSTTLKLGCR